MLLNMSGDQLNTLKNTMLGFLRSLQSCLAKSASQPRNILKVYKKMACLGSYKGFPQVKSVG